MASYTYNTNYNTRGSCSSNSHFNNKTQQQWQPRRTQTRWEAGHLAFLTSCNNYNEEDYHNLIESKEIPPKATNHPCVILQRFHDSDHCLITPVSAFSASEETNFLPPWKQWCHRHKKVQDFRSFRGSESSSSGSDSDSSCSNGSNTSCQFLELQNGRTMPKPKASWIYIQHIYVVPVHLLIPFKKPGRGEREPREPRQLTDASLATLRAHIQQKCTVFQKRINTLNQFRWGSQQAPFGCNEPDQPQQCSSSLYQFHREVNQAYKALGSNDQSQRSGKPSANSNANATITTSSKTMSSTASSPQQGPWRKVQSAPASPAPAKSTPNTHTKKGPNQQQKTPQPPKIANGTRWNHKA
ncbi:hypothetical protein PG993_003819 [Apiospora rasikravindrae]|uniref:Uncharacterized protein n=1 Tax=Apiospora rasikravindrae TaxID=990691 RepID=A0ABR1U0L2_9PEZI